MARTWIGNLLLFAASTVALAGESASGALAQPAIWFHDGRLTRPGEQLMGELARAGERGLLATDYDTADLKRQLPTVNVATPATLARLDSALSALAARLASDLHLGRVSPSDVGYELDVKRGTFDVPGAVARLAASSDVSATLDSLEPQLHHYSLLKQALARYRGLDATSRGLVQLPALPRPRVRPGESYPDAPALRRLLTALGDAATFDPALADEPTLDPALVDALERFQGRHGLDTDGVLGRGTFRALTTPFSARVQQIELSLERIRWLPSPLASPPIIVNIPQFRLFAFRTTKDSAQDILQMNVIVGDAFPARRTPVFAAEMSYAVLQPYWDVPRSILLKELLPDIRARAGWVDDHGYEIVRGQGDDASPLPVSAQNVELLARGVLRLRQKPGPSNALGRVKFMFPNSHNVYLHDTPARGLFSRSRRALSHGCIRVSDPMALLEHVMHDDPAWTVERRDRALALDVPTRIPLPRRIPVFIVYGTALATESGQVQFFDDIYAQDAPLIAKLSARGERP